MITAAKVAVWSMFWVAFVLVFLLDGPFSWACMAVAFAAQLTGYLAFDPYDDNCGCPTATPAATDE